MTTNEPDGLITEVVLAQGLIAQTALALQLGCPAKNVDEVLRVVALRTPAKSGSGIIAQFSAAIAKVRVKHERAGAEQRRVDKNNIQNWLG